MDLRDRAAQELLADQSSELYSLMVARVRDEITAFQFEAGHQRVVEQRMTEILQRGEVWAK